MLQPRNQSEFNIDTQSSKRQKPKPLPLELTVPHKFRNCDKQTLLSQKAKAEVECSVCQEMIQKGAIYYACPTCRRYRICTAGDCHLEYINDA